MKSPDCSVLGLGALPVSAFSRREFLKTASAMTGSLAWASPFSLGAAEAAPSLSRWPIAVFSKVHHNELGLDYAQTADLVAEAGFEGIDCPVRPGGQVLPERVADDLPRLAGLLQQRGLRLYKITTHITSLRSAQAEAVLRAAAKLKVKYYRLGTFSLPNPSSVYPRLREITAQLKDLAALNRELGLCGLLQNHSGGYVGAEVWDAYEIVRPYDSQQLALAFDIGHATAVLESGWHAVLELVRSHLGIAYVKDYDRQTKKWVALGEGSADKRFLSVLKQLNYQGFISQHFEFEVPGAKGPELNRNMLRAMRQDVQTLKRWIAEAQAA